MNDSLGRWVLNGDGARDVHRVRHALPGYVTRRTGVGVPPCAARERARNQNLPPHRARFQNSPPKVKTHQHPTTRECSHPSFIRDTVAARDLAVGDELTEDYRLTTWEGRKNPL